MTYKHSKVYVSDVPIGKTTNGDERFPLSVAISGTVWHIVGVIDPFQDANEKTLSWTLERK